MSKAATSCNPQVKNNCNDCRLAAICLPISLELEDINQLDNIIKRGQLLHKNDALFLSESPFTSIYAVRSGSIKTSTRSLNGEEQITGFYLPGEILGLDGLATDTYTNNAIALETTAICEIPFTQLETLSLQIPSLQRRFFQIMGKEIHHEQQLISLLSKKSADEKIASLLVSISVRNTLRGLSPLEFILPMSRSDIGSYLGLTIETVSRTFSKLTKRDVIDIDKKNVVIKQLDTLKDLAAA